MTGYDALAASPMERFVVRLVMTAVVLFITAVFLPVLMVLKLAEGVFFAARVTHESLSQVWASPRVGKRSADEVCR